MLAQLDQTLLGRRQLHRMVLVGILSRGHILLEGLPGVGKTALIKALGQTLSDHAPGGELPTGKVAAPASSSSDLRAAAPSESG